jgi:TRAP-type C4-dicarboxylate transport system substrate-binding protein
MKSLNRKILAVLLLAFYSISSQAITLKIATVAPAGTVWMKEMKAGANTISDRTQGRVKLKFYPGGVMGSEQAVHRKIKVGQLQGGAFSSGGLADVYPDIQCLNLPMLFDTFDEVDYVRARMEPVMKTNLEANGFVLLGIAEGGFTRILSKFPIRDLEAVRASKLWAPEGDLMVRETYRSMGLAPVYLPISDVYTALQTGLVDTVTVTPSLAIAFQWHSSTAYVTDMPLIYLVGLIAVQKRSFDKISATDQAVVREEIGKVAKQLDVITRADNRRAIEALQKQGIQFIKPDSAEIARWKRLAEQSVERLIGSGALTRGGVDRVRGYLADYRNAAAQ